MALFPRRHDTRYLRVKADRCVLPGNASSGAQQAGDREEHHEPTSFQNFKAACRKWVNPGRNSMSAPLPFCSPLRRQVGDMLITDNWDLLDYRIGKRKQLIRNIETDRLSRLDVDDQLELGRLFNR
jgi:hypothetical protein